MKAIVAKLEKFLDAAAAKLEPANWCWPGVVIVQGGRADQPRNEDEILADIRRELAAQGAPDDVLDGPGIRAVACVIVAPAPTESVEETAAKLAEASDLPGLKQAAAELSQEREQRKSRQPSEEEVVRAGAELQERQRKRRTRDQRALRDVELGHLADGHRDPRRPS
jgi:hypothetical protein